MDGTLRACKADTQQSERSIAPELIELARPAFKKALSALSKHSLSIYKISPSVIDVTFFLRQFTIYKFPDGCWYQYSRNITFTLAFM
jgi:hypothetical protein